MKGKNRFRPATSHADLVFEQEMHELADAISEKSQTPSLLADPFEEYVEVIRTKIHSNPHIFRSRLAKGYSALLYELQDEDVTKTNG